MEKFQPDIRTGAEKKDKVSELAQFIEAAALELRNSGVPVSPDGRIDMSSFDYPDAKDDIRRAEEWQKEWSGNMTKEERDRKRLQSDGEKLELLAHAIFHKNMKDKFIVVRSSLHDDRRNGVDTILVERATGNVVCAFDEVGSASGAEFQAKQTKVFSMNSNDKGAKLKYGVSLDKQGQIKLGPMENLPIFYIALPKDKIDKGIAEFDPSPESQSELEKKLFEYFVAILQAQIKGLRLYTARLDPTLKSRLDTFENAVNK